MLQLQNVMVSCANTHGECCSQADLDLKIMLQNTLCGLYNTMCKSLTVSWVAKLPAHHTSICRSPKIITHSPPLSTLAHLHSSLINQCSSDQPDITICTSWEMEMLSLDPLEKFHSVVCRNPPYWSQNVNICTYFCTLIVATAWHMHDLLEWILCSPNKHPWMLVPQVKNNFLI